MCRWLIIGFTGILLLLAACGGSAPAPSTTAPVVPTQTPQASSSPSPTPTKVDAAGVVAQLKAAGIPVGKTIVYTAKTDVNHLLGRPNGYLSKAAFVDRRIKPSEVVGSTSGDVVRGGSIEVFKDAAGAQARKKYIQGLIKAAPILGAEYDYVIGTVLARISDVLTPSQARAYRSALGDEVTLGL